MESTKAQALELADTLENKPWIDVGRETVIKVLRALAQVEAAQPAAEGWALVPREPTKEMIEAGRLAANRVFTDLGITDPDDERIGTQAHNRKCARACYIAAIAASPNAASQGGTDQ